jgi:hypothetical protein
MRKFVLALMAVTFLSAGSAFAQSGYWVGAAGSLAGPSLHFGVKDVVPNFDLRASVNSNYAFNGFGVSVATLFNIDLGVDTGAATYLGVGFSADLTSASGATVDGFVGFDVNLGEYGLSAASFFIEVGGAFRWPLANTGLIARAGVNYRF